MKNFKTRIVTLCLAVLMLLSISGCAKRGECDGCGQNEKLREFVQDNGKTYWYCDDCYRIAKIFN